MFVTGIGLVSLTRLKIILIRRKPYCLKTQRTDDRTPVQQEAADIPQPGHPEDERLSASNDADSGPLLQRPQVVQQLCTHEGIITQANLHKQHLTQHCGFCQRWIAETRHDQKLIYYGFIKKLPRPLTLSFMPRAPSSNILLKRDQPCRWCGQDCPWGG